MLYVSVYVHSPYEWYGHIAQSFNKRLILRLNFELELEMFTRAVCMHNLSLLVFVPDVLIPS